MVVDYTVGVATNDKAKQDKAVADLIGYTQDFGAFLQSANPNLPNANEGKPVEDSAPATTPTPAPAPSQPSPSKPITAALHGFTISIKPRADALARGVNPVGILDELRELGEARVVANLDSLPPLESLDPGPQTLAICW